MKKSELLKQGNYLTVIKPLAHKIGLEETIILMELVGMEEYKKDKHLLYKEMMESENKKIDPKKVKYYEEDDAFECTATELQLATTIKEGKQTRLLKQLVELNLLKFENRGLPSKRFIILNHENIGNMLNTAINEYQDFKNKFFEEKKEFIQKKMAKRKEKKEEKIQFLQNEGTDKLEGLEGANTEKPQSGQFLQNEGTSDFDLVEQVPSKKPPLNNNQSIKISSNNNLEDLSIYEDKIIKLDFAEPIKIVLMKKIDRLIKDNIELDKLLNMWKSEKNSDSGLNEYQFASMLDTALTYAKKPITKTDNFFTTAIAKLKSQSVESNSIQKFQPVRIEQIPEYMNEDSERIEAKSIEELEAHLEKLISFQSEELFSENDGILEEIHSTKEKIEQLRREKAELDELLKPYKKTV
ncbi:hypothetical protein WMO40_20600 [Bacillaceae bacterium CLA-AA-H227]|uniref:Uncharacterized protein n=1 Tax=Robertmurraya yapensis (ex Hitch et al 2024) TaxID=3133160 RepID=A0ACC6SGB6_9BACI